MSARSALISSKTTIAFQERDIYRVGAEGEEIKIVGFFDDLSGQFGLRHRERFVKIGESFSLAPMQVRFDLVSVCSGSIQTEWFGGRTRAGRPHFSRGQRK
jgi:hypothetical protein